MFDFHSIHRRKWFKSRSGPADCTAGATQLQEARSFQGLKNYSFPVLLHVILQASCRMVLAEV